MFSIISVVLNDPAGLRLTASSIKMQSLSDFEWIIVDGASSDKTLSVLNEFDSINPVIYSAEDKGIYDAMNKGVRASSGNYMIFMNAGDSFADESVLSDIKVFLNLHPDVDVVLGGTYRNINKCAFYSPPKDIRWINNGLPAFHQSTVYRAELMYKRGYDLDYCLLADYEWLAFHCVSGINVGYLNRPVSNYFVGGASYTNIKVKFNDLFLVKRTILQRSWFYSAATSVVAILKTLLVMKVLCKVCSLYGYHSGRRKKNKISSAFYEAKSEYYKYKEEDVSR